MAVERDLELLDDYLSNRMSGAEKEAFEKQLDADIELKSEYQSQQQLIQGIKSARTAELKTMLKNIPVSPSMAPGEATLFTKVAASLVVAGLIGTGVYFFLNRDDKPEQTITEPLAQAKPEVTEKTELKTTTEEPVLKSITTETPAPQASEKTSVREERRASRKVSRAAKKASKDSASIVSNPGVIAEKRKLEVFDPTRESESAVKSKNKEATGSETATLNENASSIQVETDNTNKKYTFHYQWKNGKLLLYGSFEKNLYEILEFFGTDDKRTAFLYYKENYYLLNEDNEKVKELTPITDPTLLKKLKEHREN